MLLLLIFAGGLAFSLASGNELRYPDEFEYHELALRMVRGLGFTTPELGPTAYRPPGYPIFLALVYLLGAKPIIAKIANSLLLTACGWMLWKLVGRTTQLGAVLALVLVAVYPLFPYAAGTLFPQILGSAMFLLFVLILTGAPLRLPTALAGGLLYGVLILTIPAFLLLLPVIFFDVIAARADRLGARLLRVSVMLFAVIVVVGSWSMRNWLAFDRFLLVSANGGENLLIGNCENTQPNSGVNTDISHYRAMAEDLDQVGKDRFFRHEAISWLRGNPRQAARLYLLKVLNYFNFRNELWTASEESALKQIVVFVTYYPLLLLAIVRLAVHKRLPFSATEVLLYFLYFSNALLSAVFFTRLRFRIPFDFILVAIVALFLGQVLTRGCRTAAGTPVVE